MPDRSTVRFLGANFACTTMSEAAAHLISLAKGVKDHGADVHLCNAYTMQLAKNSAQLGDVISEASLNLADGQALVWAVRFAGVTGASNLHRIPGPDLFERVLEEGQAFGLSHFLLGTTDETLRDLEHQILSRYPDVVLAGQISPPFRQQTDAEMEHLSKILDNARPDIVWVGLGTPQQDFEAHRLARRHPFVFVAVGAAFDFSAKTKRRAPKWMQRSGLEWSFRLATEPKRLWRRYLIESPKFVLAVILERVFRA